MTATNEAIRVSHAINMETEIEKLNFAARVFFSALRDFQDNTEVEVDDAIENVDHIVDQLTCRIEI